MIEEVRHRSLPLYNRLKTLTRLDDKNVWVFYNEYRSLFLSNIQSRETAIFGNEGETPNDRNDRGMPPCWMCRLDWDISSQESVGQHNGIHSIWNSIDLRVVVKRFPASDRGSLDWGCCKQPEGIQWRYHCAVRLVYLPKAPTTVLNKLEGMKDPTQLLDKLLAAEGSDGIEPTLASGKRTLYPEVSFLASNGPSPLFTMIQYLPT